MTETGPLHILHTESSCGWGGQEIRILTEARGMLDRGHEVTIACPPEAPIFSAAHKHGIPVVAQPIARKKLGGIAALRQYLKSQARVQVLNTHSSTDSWLSALACATLRRAPVIVRTRHVSTRIGNNAPTRWLYQRAAQHIVTTGEALRAQLVRDNGFDATRITSIPTGIDLVRYCPMDKRAARTTLGLDTDAHYLGIVATLRNWKGHLYLLEALASLASQHPGWRLLMVGDGPLRQKYETMIANLGLREHVIMPGNREDVPLWLNSMDIFVLPSYGEEGISQSVMQAMACQLPVITTTVGALPEAVVDEETGLLVPPRDVVALKGAIDRLMRDAPLRVRLGGAGHKRAQTRFGLGLMLDGMEQVFRRALAEQQTCAA